MNKKCLIKFEHDNTKDLMHYVVYDGDLVVLSRYESKKVDYIDKHKKLSVSFDIEAKTYDLLNAEVVTDESYVKEVYDYMINTNNAYFKDGIDGLCAIKLYKE